jgi:hypothetical protein
MNTSREISKSGQARFRSRSAWVSRWATRSWVLPKLLLYLLLGYICRFLLWAMDVVGLSSLLDLRNDHQVLLQDGATCNCPLLVLRPLALGRIAEPLDPPRTSAAGPLPLARRRASILPSSKEMLH